MKHNELRAIGHNIADSFVSGASALTGCYSLPDVFDEVKKCPDGFIVIDFLNGTSSSAASDKLANAVSLFAAALPELCAKHDASISDFRALTASFSCDDIGGRTVVTIIDKNGRCTKDEYIGLPLRHIKTVDKLGRVRTKRAGSETAK